MTPKDFYGEVNGDTINGFYKYLDKGIRNYEGRLAQVMKVYYADEAWTQLREIWYDLFENDRIKVNLNSTDSVMSETNVCKLQEACCTYLLFSDEAKNMRDEDDEKIIVLDDIRMSRGESRNISLDSLLENEESDLEHVLAVEKNNDNYKLQIKQVITEADYKDPEIADVLRCYKLLIDTIDYEVSINELGKQDPNEFCTCEHVDEETPCICEESREIMRLNSDITRRNSFLSKIKTEITLFDMLQVKDQIKKTIYFKAITTSMPVEKYINLDNYDYWNKELIRLLAKCEVNKCGTEFGKMYAEKFENAYDSVMVELEDQDIEIFESWRNDVNMQDYADSCDMNHKSVHSRIKAILNLIQRQMIENYELDYYYTELVKGKWKTCSKCGETKIANEYYFARQSTGKDGFRAYCKKCQAEMVK